MPTTTKKISFPATLPTKKVLPVMLYRRDIENMFLLEQDEQVSAVAEGRKERSQAHILRDLAEAEVQRKKLRE
mgnify:CR=1 FL=1